MIRFGTGGWRAVIGEDFTQENVRRVAAGILALMREEGRTDRPVVIGYDRRFLSEPAARWTAEVLAAGGVDVWFMNRSAPTPLVMFTVMNRGLHYGIEITASHNPARYDGVKLVVGEGRDAPPETTRRVEELVAALPDATPPLLPFDEAVAAGRIAYPKNPFNPFIDSILARIDVAALRERGLRVLFDTMHGSGAYPLLVVFYTARCTIDTMNMNKDAWFDGQMPAPNPKSLSSLADAVVKGGYDLGIAMDGDGDRLGIIDRTGRYVSANEILCMLYDYLVRCKGWRGPVVRNVATTHLLDRIAESFGEKCHEVPVGFKHVSAKIDETDAVLGGESSGGLTVRGHIHGKDSAYAASLFAEMVSVTGKSPSELAADLEARFGAFRMAEDAIRFEDAARKAAVERLLLEEKKLPSFADEIERVGYEDGCKVYFKGGDWTLCRFSGTEPLLRVCAESSTEEKARSYVDAFRSFLGV